MILQDDKSSKSFTLCNEQLKVLTDTGSNAGFIPSDKLILYDST